MPQPKKTAPLSKNREHRRVIEARSAQKLREGGGRDLHIRISGETVQHMADLRVSDEITDSALIARAIRKLWLSGPREDSGNS
jgi:hypothetical protein